MSIPQSQWSPGTWGLTIGLLGFSVATLAGVAAGQEPETILTRAVVGASLAAALAHLAAQLVQLGQRSLEEE